MVCDQRCDFNGDGVVDKLDQAILNAAFGSRPGDSNWNPACDFNGDGVIDIGDATIFGQSFGCTFGDMRIVSINILTGSTLEVDGVEVI